jgi:hypothetical protein
MDKILVHICCGVDAVWALRKIKEEFQNSEIKGFFYDPNIHPEEEYELRWIETKRVCDDLGIECIKGEYELDKWMEKVKGYENEPERGERCSICHDLRLEKTAKLAKENQFNKITTVLMMSPKKDFDVLKNIGETIASKYGLEFLSIDFRKKGGVQKMNELSKEKELYHQNYCGCIYGLFQQRKGLEYIPELVSFGKGRIAGSREELLFVKRIRSFAENLGIMCEEQNFDFQGWKLISSKLSIKGNPILHTVLINSKSIRGILRAKVKELLTFEDKIVVKLNKSNAEIWILNSEIKEIPLSEPRYFTNPVFVVGKENKELIKENIKIEMQLKTEFNPDSQSQNLIIGSKFADEFIFFHSDSLPDGSFEIDENEVYKKIEENLKDLKIGKKAVIIFGAETFGKLGRKIFESENSFVGR